MLRKAIYRNTVGITAILVLAMAFHPPPASAGSVLGVDVQDYIVMYEGGTSAHLAINNFGTTGIWTGDIGIAGVGTLAATGPGTLNGNVNFAAANTGQASVSNTTINGTVSFNVSSVQTIMTNLNTLSSTLGALAGSGTALAINTSTDQTVLATDGASGTINGTAYRLFNVTSVGTNNAQNLIIKGDGSESVVLDVNTPGDAQFHGNILLQDLSGRFFGDAGYAGVTPDQLLINLYAGVSLVGGDKLDANDNGNNCHPSNIIYGAFLDPNGAISFVNTRIVGRILGGDSRDMQIVSGDTITLPTPPSPPVPTPEPASLTLLGTSMLGLGLASWRRRK